MTQSQANHYDGNTVSFHLPDLPPAVLTASFLPCVASTVAACGAGLAIRAEAQSRDPSVSFRMAPLFEYARSDMPVNAADLGAVVFGVRASCPGYFEVFFTAGDITVPTGRYSCGNDYFGGENDIEYILIPLSDTGDRWTGTVHDHFRLDWASYCDVGDTLTVTDVSFFRDAQAAKAYTDAGNRNRVPFSPRVKAPEAPETVAPGYYVCLHERLLKSKSGEIIGRFDCPEQAVSLCDEYRVYGYRVADGDGRVVYSPYTRLQSDILREAKYVTDYARINEFRYGDAPINPGIDNRAKLVSCDRLVCWVLYRLGFVRQPYVQGVVVSAFPDWCRAQGFELIRDFTSLEPGDIMLVRPHPRGYPQHAFIFAGYCDKPAYEPNFPAVVAHPDAPAGPDCPVMYSYRYDCGSNARIQSVQPSRECLFHDAYTPVELCRPVVTPDNNVFYSFYQTNPKEADHE